MRQLPPSRSSAGYSPNRLQPLAVAPVLDQGQRLTDIQAIQRLFANGENGGYWPADPAYLYEGSTGNTLASLNGVVGFQYDISRGLALGPDLITNGTFDSDTWWTKTGSASISGGMGHLLNVSSIEKAISHTPNVSYLVTYDAVIRSGSVRTQLVGTQGITRTTSGTFTDVLSAATGGTFYIVGVAGSDVDIDNVSVKQIYGNHALQATTANKPYLRRTPVSGKYWLDSNTATGALTATFGTSLGSACTIATVGAEGVTIDENQTVGTTYNIAPAYGYNGDILIINRALTAVEKALVMRVLGRGVPTLGSELIKNGEFDVDTSGFTAISANIESVSGELAITNTSTGYGFAYQLLSLSANKTYYSKVTGRKGTNGGFGIQAGSSSTAGTWGYRNSGSATMITLIYLFTPTTANVYCQLWTQNNNNGNTAYFDNFSLKAIL